MLKKYCNFVSVNPIQRVHRRSVRSWNSVAMPEDGRETTYSGMSGSARKRAFSREAAYKSRAAEEDKEAEQPRAFSSSRTTSRPEDGRYRRYHSLAG